MELLKKVAERGQGGKTLIAAREAFERGNHQQALLHYLRAADAGFELGQANAAWLLQHGLGYGSACVSACLHDALESPGRLDKLLDQLSVCLLHSAMNTCLICFSFAG